MQPVQRGSSHDREPLLKFTKVVHDHVKFSRYPYQSRPLNLRVNPHVARVTVGMMVIEHLMGPFNARVVKTSQTSSTIPSTMQSP
jgi:hypothetical protein